MTDSQMAFDKIHSTFRPKILRYLTRLVGGHEAEDLTQEVFIRVNRALKDYRGDSQLSTWIYRIATNVATDRLRSPSYRQEVRTHFSENSISEVGASVDGKDAMAGETTPLVDQELIRKEMNACIRNFIESLPDDYRTVIILSELEGLKNAEIAEILGVSLGTIKIRLHRARARLKKELETNCSFYRDEHNEFACDQKRGLREFRNRD